MNSYEIIKSILDEVDPNIQVLMDSQDVVTVPPIITYDIMQESTHFRDNSMDIRNITISVWCYSKDKSSGIELKEKVIEKMDSYNIKLRSMTNVKSLDSNIFVLRFKCKMMKHNNKIEIYQ